MDEQKRPRAWVYARIPGDYDGTMNSYKVCSMQALHDGCDIGYINSILPQPTERRQADSKACAAV